MGRYGKSLRAVMAEISQSSERSTLFWWLVEHHDEIAGAAAGRRLQWGALCVRFAEAGLTDLSGKPATAETARRTWHRVRRMVAEARDRQAAEAAKPRRVGAIPPSRIPKDWKPEAFRQPTAPETASPSGARPVAAQPPGTALALPPSSSSSLSDPMSKEARAAMVLPGMPAWTAPTGRYVEDEDSPEVKAKLLRAEAQHRALDRHFGPPLPRREE